MRQGPGSHPSTVVGFHLVEVEQIGQQHHHRNESPVTGCIFVTVTDSLDALQHGKRKICAACLLNALLTWEKISSEFPPQQSERFQGRFEIIKGLLHGLAFFLVGEAMVRGNLMNEASKFRVLFVRVVLWWDRWDTWDSRINTRLSVSHLDFALVGQVGQFRGFRVVSHRVPRLAGAGGTARSRAAPCCPTRPTCPTGILQGLLERIVIQPHSSPSQIFEVKT